MRKTPRVPKALPNTEIRDHITKIDKAQSGEISLSIPEKHPATKRQRGRPRKKEQYFFPKPQPHVKKAGRPRVEINWDIVDALLKMQCTGEEVAGFINIDYDTLNNGCKCDKNVIFSEYSATKRQGGKASLRRRQWLMSQTSPALAIWLGKQYLGQSDKLESSGNTDREITVRFVDDDTHEQERA